METLSVRVRKGTKEKIDRQVRARGYKNSSEVLRKIIEEHFEEHPELFATDDLTEITEEAEKISDKEFEKMTTRIFKGPKNASELVGEGRER